MIAVVTVARQAASPINPNRYLASGPALRFSLGTPSHIHVAARMFVEAELTQPLVPEDKRLKSQLACSCCVPVSVHLLLWARGSWSFLRAYNKSYITCLLQLERHILSNDVRRRSRLGAWACNGCHHLFPNSLPDL
jgi:hypothetical protein